MRVMTIMELQLNISNMGTAPACSAGFTDDLVEGGLMPRDMVCSLGVSRESTLPGNTVFPETTKILSELICQLPFEFKIWQIKNCGYKVTFRFSIDADNYMQASGELSRDEEKFLLIITPETRQGWANGNSIYYRFPEQGPNVFMIIFLDSAGLFAGQEAIGMLGAGASKGDGPPKIKQQIVDEIPHESAPAPPKKENKAASKQKGPGKRAWKKKENAKNKAVSSELKKVTEMVAALDVAAKDHADEVAEIKKSVHEGACSKDCGDECGESREKAIEKAKAEAMKKAKAERIGLVSDHLDGMVVKYHEPFFDPMYLIAGTFPALYTLKPAVAVLKSLGKGLLPWRMFRSDWIPRLEKRYLEAKDLIPQINSDLSGGYIENTNGSITFYDGNLFSIPYPVITDFFGPWRALRGLLANCTKLAIGLGACYLTYKAVGALREYTQSETMLIKRQHKFEVLEEIPPETVGDERPDSLAVGKIKHNHPLMRYVEYTENLVIGNEHILQLRSQGLETSMEHVAQTWNSYVCPISSTAEDVALRIEYSNRNVQSINFSKYHPFSPHAAWENTGLVNNASIFVHAMQRQYWEKIKHVPFPRPPATRG